MRWMGLAFALVAGTAEAKDCVPPKLDERGSVATFRGLTAFSECMIAKVSTLEKENASLRKDLDRILDAVQQMPGAFLNDNGKVSRSGGESLVQATFTANARRREGPAALPVDQQVLEGLCGVSCTITLVVEGEALRKGDPSSVSEVTTCILRYSARNGAWSQGGGCGDAVSGVDGDGRPPGNSGGDVIATAGEACILADSEPSRNVGPQDQLLDGDRTKGLYLIAIPTLFQGTEARFRCELRIAR